MVDPHIRRLFAHMQWADRRLARLMESDEAAHRPETLRLYAHVVGAERVWLLRLRGDDSSAQPVWPEITLAEAVSLAEANHAEYDAFLASLGPDDLGAEVAYRTQQGVPFTSTLGDILVHVALHGSYHRGQIAAAVRAAGGEPVSTDFIVFARDGA